MNGSKKISVVSLTPSSRALFGLRRQSGAATALWLGSPTKALMRIPAFTIQSKRCRAGPPSLACCRSPKDASARHEALFEVARAPPWECGYCHSFCFEQSPPNFVNNSGQLDTKAGEARQFQAKLQNLVRGLR